MLEKKHPKQRTSHGFYAFRKPSFTRFPTRAWATTGRVHEAESTAAKGLCVAPRLKNARTLTVPSAGSYRASSAALWPNAYPKPYTQPPTGGISNLTGSLKGPDRRPSKSSLHGVGAGS